MTSADKCRRLTRGRWMNTRHACNRRFGAVASNRAPVSRAVLERERNSARRMKRTQATPFERRRTGTIAKAICR